MASNVKFQDFSFDVKVAIDEETIAWLYTWGNEIASQAARNCAMDGKVGEKLKGSYRSVVDESKGKATIGTPMEAGFWEEFGTGSQADTVKNGGKQGRDGWWVYVKDGELRKKESKHYQTEAQAQAIAESMCADGFDAYATNGRDPNYTLEKAFKSVKPKAESNLETILKRRLGK